MKIKGFVERAQFGVEEPQIIKKLREHEARLLADPELQARKREIDREINREMLRLAVPVSAATILAIAGLVWVVSADLISGLVFAFLGSSVYGVPFSFLLFVVAKEGVHSDSAFVRSLCWGGLGISGLYLLGLAATMAAIALSAFR